MRRAKAKWEAIKPELNHDTDRLEIFIK
jgi:hypothetical protein